VAIMSAGIDKATEIIAIVHGSEMPSLCSFTRLMVIFAQSGASVFIIKIVGRCLVFISTWVFILTSLTTIISRKNSGLIVSFNRKNSPAVFVG